MKYRKETIRNGEQWKSETVILRGPASEVLEVLKFQHNEKRNAGEITVNLKPDTTEWDRWAKEFEQRMERVRRQAGKRGV